MADELYHGTRRGVERGGWVTPACQHGRPRANELTDYPDANEWLFVTPDFEVAKAFALMGTGRGAPKVCRVEPTEDIYPDFATLNGEDGLMFRTRGWAKVVEVTKVTE